jgi:hypothetical protein
MASLAIVSIATAQITGDIRGTVTDGSGGSVISAQVTLRNLGSGEIRTAAVAADGSFGFPLLKIGTYEIKAEAPGFRGTVTQAEVKAGEIANAKLVLEVGQVTEVVTVTDAVATLDTQNAQIQTAITGAAVLNIPVNRNPNLFALTLPGVTPVTSNNSFLGSGSFNSNGGRGRGNNITVDGVTTTDVSTTGTGGVLTPLIFQTIAEVKVITNNFSAEYGRNSSAQAIYLTKSGTNALHGELFEFFQNDKLNARPYFDTTGKTNIVRFNQYGFEVGGPAYIPKLFDGRNKAFFHVAYEGQKQRGAGATRIARVPTPAQAASVTDPTARAIMQQYQVPTDPSGQISTAAPSTADVWKVNLRGDIVLSSRDTIWLRYNPASSVTASTSLTFVGSNLPGFGATSQGRPRQAIGAHTHTFGAAAVNEFRFGFGQSDSGFPIDTPYPLGVRVIFQDAGVTNLGVWEGLPQGREQKTFEFNDNFSLVRGSHNFKMGGQYYYLEADSIFDALQRPVLSFPSFADFGAGRPAIWQQRFGNSLRANRVKNLFLYLQDDWKVKRNLTLNLGLRMEYAGGPTEKGGRISNLNFANTQPFGAAGGGPFGLLELGKPSFASNYNWGPRLGFAWTPGRTQRTVVRGGYGLAFDFIFLNPITNQRFLPPLIVTGALTGAASFTGTNSLANLVAGSAQVQRETASQVGALSTTTRNFGTISPAIDADLANPQVHQWNLGVQHEFAGGWVAKASYVGTKGNFLPRSRDLNLVASPARAATSVADETARIADFTTQFQRQSGALTAQSNRIDPRYNAIVFVESSANSNYHSGQFELIRRTRTMLFNAAYTFGKSIDDGSDVLGVLINDSSNQQNPLDNKNNRAPSQFDIRQRLAFTHNWEIPWGRGHSNWMVSKVLAGWGFSGITSFRSGFPVTIEAGPRRGLNPLTVLGGGGAVRPNVSGPLSLNFVPARTAGAPFGTVNPDGQQAVSAFANSIGLTQPLLGNFGSLGRNAVRLNGESNFDLNLYKNFHVTEGRYLQFRAEFYNSFNNTSFQDVNRTITQTDFGQYITVAQNSRLIQLGLRFVF